MSHISRYDVNKGMLLFADQGITRYHAVENIRQELIADDYIELKENDEWSLLPGKSYYVVRNGSSIIAFRTPETLPNSFMVMASHSDSPCFKLKSKPEINNDKHVVLNVEQYGGGLMPQWMDRPLGIAGRILYEKDGEIKSELVDSGRDLVMIPSLCIHFNREVNSGYKYNVQKDMLPIFSMGEAKPDELIEYMSKNVAGIMTDEILGSDLFLYDRSKGTTWGEHFEFISACRLDDLQCAYGTLRGFLEAEESAQGVMPVYCCFDNEEVGSRTLQGADGTFLSDILTRVVLALGGDMADMLRAVAGGFLVSADNAQGYHPNYAEKYDAGNRVYMNEGVVLKYSANQKYTTDGASAAFLKKICKDNDIKVQEFHNRSDVPGGSTLGNLSIAHVALMSADIGLAQLAMHSPYETAGAKDTEQLVNLAKAFYSHRKN